MALVAPGLKHQDELKKRLGQMGKPVSEAQKTQAAGQAMTLAGQQAGAQSREVARTELGSGQQPGQYAQAQEGITKAATEAAVSVVPQLEAQAAQVTATRDAQTLAALEREADRRLQTRMEKKALRKEGGSGQFGSALWKGLGGVGIDKVLGML